MTRHFYIVAGLYFFLTAASVAQNSSGTMLRAEFAKAYGDAASTGTASLDASGDSTELRGYALYPYLELARLRFRLNGADSTTDANDQQAAQFLRRYGSDVVANELWRAWYPQLIKRQAWETLLTNYRDVGDDDLRCQALNARLALGRTENLEAAAVAEWSSAADSQPGCREIFDWLKSQGRLSDALVEKRARLALKQANPGFARQMIALLPENKAAPLLAWAQLIERPLAGIDVAIAKPQTPIEPAALLDGWIRLARSDATSAARRYKALLKARDLSWDEASPYSMELALALSWNRDASSLSYFAQVKPSVMDERGYEWYARAALWVGQWQRAEKIIESMPDALRTQAKWRYWRARCAQLRGRHVLAKNLYAALLGDDNYYAALAAARMNKGYVPVQQAVDVDQVMVQALAARPAFSRARELLQLNSPELRQYAYDEWRKDFARLNVVERRQAIALAAHWQWHDQAILTAAQQGVFDDYALLYPRPYDVQVRTAAQLTQLPATLIYATIRQESLYRADVRSPAGAVGLMQLLPDTAKRTAKRWPNVTRTLADAGDLTDPTTNILLGAAQLRDLVDRSSELVPVALAGYNAGPNAASRWLPKRKLDIDVWIENIPYNETRTYVQRILWHSVVFGWLLTGEPQDTTPWLVELSTR